MSKQVYKYSKRLHLENGEYISNPEICFHTYGKLNEAKSNVVWICHAFTANSDPMDWWPGMVGASKFFDPDKYFIVCANILGSCYGSTGPLSINPETNKPWYRSFPGITVRDMVKAHQLLADHLGIDRIEILAGASVGGQQALEWAIIDTSLIKNLILIETNERFKPWGIAFNASQRMAIETDPTFALDIPEGGLEGMKTARSIALLSYRNQHAYNNTQEENDPDKVSDFKAESYQRYQGEKLAVRFNAYSYHVLSRALDSHNVGRGRDPKGLGNSSTQDSVEAALGMITARTLLVAVESDILFSIEEQQYMERHIPNALLKIIDSKYGHDGFLLENEKLSELFNDFINERNDNK
jgi:homoserine O-acetyltransferase